MTHLTSTCVSGATSASAQAPTGQLFGPLSTQTVSRVFRLGVNNVAMVEAFGLAAGQAVTFERLLVVTPRAASPSGDCCVVVPESDITVTAACPVQARIDGCGPAAYIAGPGYFRAAVPPSALGLALVYLTDVPGDVAVRNLQIIGMQA